MPPMAERFVLDAWALLALLKGEEPAAGRVKELLTGAERGAVDLFVSIINLGEVYYIVGRLKGEAEASRTLSALKRLPVGVVAAGEAEVLAAARLKMRYRIAYADAFAAGAARSLGATLVTGDPELAALQGEVKIEYLRRGS